MTATPVARLAAAEFVGTMIVMLAGPGLLVFGGDGVGRVEVALGYGLATALAIGVIGAMANPMLSLALWFGKSITSRELLADWVGQLLGAIVGGAILFGLNDTDRFSVGTNGWEPSSDFGAPLTGFEQLGVVIGAELVLGTIVVLVLLSTIRERWSATSSAAFVGGAVALAALFLEPISGVGINPARSIGTAIFADTNPNALGQVWIFVLVPLVAAFTGLVAYLAIDDATIDETVFDDTIVEDVSDAITRD